MADRQDLTGFYYALISGIPGLPKHMRTKAFRKYELAEKHANDFESRFPSAKVEGFYQVVNMAPDELRDRHI